MNKMNEVTIGAPMIERAIARSRIYALLAMGFRYPEEYIYRQFADGTYADTIAGAFNVCAVDLLGNFEAHIAPRMLVTVSCQELESEYLSAFETNLPKPSVSLYESSHHPQGSKSALLLELKGFYRHFGLAIAEEDCGLDDSIVAELEFMHFLTAKQAQGEEGMLDKAPYLRAQRDFLGRHLAIWLPALWTAVDAKLDQPFYKALSELASGFVAHEVEEVRREIDLLG